MPVGSKHLVEKNLEAPIHAYKFIKFYDLPVMVFENLMHHPKAKNV